MPPQQIVFVLITLLHDLFTAAWIGGLISMALVILPALRPLRDQPALVQRLLPTLQQRLSRLVYVSMVGLVLTGVLLSRRAPAFQGLFSLANPYATVLTLKHLLVALMVAVALYRSLFVLQRGAVSERGRQQLSAALLLLNLVLGVAVLALSATNAVLAPVP